MKIFSSIANISESEANGMLIWPDSCWLLSDRPLFVPDFEESFYVIPALAGKIGRIGKTIAVRFGHRYISEVTAALIMMPGSVLAKLKSGEIPSASDLCFDNALVIGDWQKIEILPDSSLTLDFRTVFQSAATGSEECIVNPDLLYPLIAEMSRKNTLKMGDIVIHPLPLSAHRVSEGDSITIQISNFADRPLLSTRFK